MPLAIEQLNLTKYDLVISSSFAVAKGILTGPDQLHVSYIHSPMRYAWDLQSQYLNKKGFFAALKNAAARVYLHRLRQWDYCSGQRPDAIIANSAFVARRIRKAFSRQATVIHPPVDTIAQAAGLPRGQHFFTASRLVTYKNVQAIVEAFAHMPQHQLIVAGTGHEEVRLRALAGPNVTFAGFVSDGELRRLAATARAFIFAAEEDFGITPVEAQAEGTPVIALSRGGALETVVAGGPTQTGLFFDEPEARSIAAAVKRFVRTESSFSREACIAQAERFTAARFRSELKSFIDAELRRHHAAIGKPRSVATAPAVLMEID